jgi:hypothetical protein
MYLKAANMEAKTMTPVLRSAFVNNIALTTELAATAEKG